MAAGLTWYLAADITKVADFGSTLRRRVAPGGFCFHHCGGMPYYISETNIPAFLCHRQSPIQFTHSTIQFTHSTISSSHTQRSSSHNQRSSSHTQRSSSHNRRSSSHTQRSSSHTQRSSSHNRRSSSHTKTYYSYKQYPALRIFATSRGLITYVKTGIPGAVGDASSYNTSKLKENIDSGHWLAGMRVKVENTKIPLFLVVDATFSFSTRLMKFYAVRAAQQTNEQKAFKYALIRTRRVVENTFGRLKARWRILVNTLVVVVYLYLTSAKCTGIAAFSLWPEATALTEMVKVELHERKKMKFYNV